MSVEAIRQSAGVSKAKVICDDCGAVEVVNCPYHRPSPNRETEPVQSQARARAIKMGWSYVKGKMRCQQCEEKRKVVPMTKQAVAEVASVATPEPTKRQRIEIFTMLAEVYDIDLGRYRNGDSDDSVAEVLGVRPGWVAQIRDDEFGPDGSNDEMAQVTEALAAATKTFEALRKALSDAEKVVAGIHTEMKAEKERVSSAMAKMNAIKAALSDRVKQKAGVK